MVAESISAWVHKRARRHLVWPLSPRRKRRAPDRRQPRPIPELPYLLEQSRQIAPATFPGCSWWAPKTGAITLLQYSSRALQAWFVRTGEPTPGTII